MSSPESSSSPATPGFAALALAPAVKRVLADVGYETPSPIQAAAIPLMLEGRDVLGQAQTGTGKTAAFALPILSRLEAAAGKPQALVLAPTRELAIQVAEAFQTYAAHIPGFRVLPIYGGTGYGPQLAGLRRGVHVVVGTPGRVIDHLKKGTLDLSELRFVVLDEADEMLNMGFSEDVDTILAKAPAERQTALFSATMPKSIRRIAEAHLKNPAEVAIAAKTATATRIHQRYWRVAGMHKLDALTRILEVEPFDAMIIFARTKQGTETLAEKLTARGFAAAAIHGDIAQPQRERMIQQLRDGQLDILVATDVAARGLDVTRISHVVNYDVPYDTESYVHRIGRTGRAGREGEAILFVTPRERGMLRAIERATRQPLEPMALPTVAAVNDRRVERFMAKITETLDSKADLAPFRALITRFAEAHEVSPTDIAAALAHMAHGSKPLLLDARDQAPEKASFEANQRDRKRTDKHFDKRFDKHGPRPERAHPGEPGKDTYRLDVGHQHHAMPGHIVGAIANEAGLDSQYIGRVTIRNDYSLIDLPQGMPADILAVLKKARVSGRPLKIRPATPDDLKPGMTSFTPADNHRPRKPGGFKPKPGAGKFHKRPGGKRPPKRRP